MRARLGFLVVLFAHAACGQDDAPAGLHDDPGTGDGTLRVRATASAEPNLIDARMPTDFQTVFRVSLTVDKTGEPVTSGSVSITSLAGKIALTVRDGQWHGFAPSYDETYTLDIVSGSHRVEDVTLQGPDIQVITSPRQGETIDASQTLRLTWERERMADHVQVIVDPEYPIKTTDTGSFDVLPYALKADHRTARRNTVHLIRTNTLEPAGAVRGSSFDVSIDNEVDVEALPL